MAKNKYGRGEKSESDKKNYHPSSHPGTQRTQPMKGVCDECHYHNSHSPTCSQNPENKK